MSIPTLSDLSAHYIWCANKPHYAPETFGRYIRICCVLFKAEHPDGPPIPRNCRVPYCRPCCHCQNLFLPVDLIHTSHSSDYPWYPTGRYFCGPCASSRRDVFFDTAVVRRADDSTPLNSDYMRDLRANRVSLRTVHSYDGLSQFLTR